MTLRESRTPPDQPAGLRDGVSCCLGFAARDPLDLFLKPSNLHLQPLNLRSLLLDELIGPGENWTRVWKWSVHSFTHSFAHE
jgi:hypothetical protein